MFTFNMVAIFLVADPWYSALEIWKETKYTFFFFCILYSHRGLFGMLSTHKS